MLISKLRSDYRVGSIGCWQNVSAAHIFIFKEDVKTVWCVYYFGCPCAICCKPSHGQYYEVVVATAAMLLLPLPPQASTCLHCTCLDEIPSHQSNRTWGLFSHYLCPTFPRFHWQRNYHIINMPKLDKHEKDACC